MFEQYLELGEQEGLDKGVGIQNIEFKNRLGRREGEHGESYKCTIEVM